MAKEPKAISPQHGNNEDSGTQSGDSRAPTRLQQLNQGDSTKPKPQQIIKDWASI